jgi:hypothetical protein
MMVGEDVMECRRLQAENAALRKIIEQQKKDGMSREAKRLIAAEVQRTEEQRAENAALREENARLSRLWSEAVGHETKQRQRAEAAEAEAEIYREMHRNAVVDQTRIEQLEAALRSARPHVFHSRERHANPVLKEIDDALLAAQPPEGKKEDQ